MEGLGVDVMCECVSGMNGVGKVVLSVCEEGVCDGEVS